MANTSTGNKVVDVLDDANEILSKLVPIIPNFMAIIGLFLRKPSVDPAVRKAAIDAMRHNFTELGINADAWLAAHGFNPDGSKKEA